MTRRLVHTRDRGAVIPIVALLLPVLMVMTAFAVDLGSQRALRRDLQADADVIALDLVRLADGRAMGAILNPVAPAPPTAFLDAVNGSFTRNGLDPVGSLAALDGVVTYGIWNEVTAVFTPSSAIDVPNAVRVTLNGEVDYSFQPGRGGATRTAVAFSTAEGVFSVGSRLVGLDTTESELLNPVLNVLLHGLGPTPSNPGGVALDVVSYEQLVGADIDINELLGILQADLVGAGVAVASPEQVLETEVTLLHIVQASADALAASGEGVDVEAAAILDLLALKLDPSITLEVGELLGAFVSETGAVVGATVNAFDLLLVGAEVVNGENLADVDLSLPPGPFESIPLVGDVVIPDVGVTVSLIEPPQIGRGVPGVAVAETSQLRVGANVGMTLDVNIGSLIPLPIGVPSLAKITLNLPVTVNAGNAKARLTDVDCQGDPALRTLGLDVDTGTAAVSVGTASPLASIRLAGLKVADVTLDAGVTVGDPTLQSLTLPLGQTDQVTGGEVGLRNLLTLDDLGIDLFGFPLLPFGLLESLVSILVNQVLGSVLGFLDQVLLSPLLDLLGAGVATADVKAIDALCGMPKLVD